MARIYHVLIHDGAAAVVRAAGVMCRTGDGRILFLKRGSGANDHPGTWCFPGGKIEPGETPIMAAQRETWEETGYRPAVSPAVPVSTGSGFATYLAMVGNGFAVKLNREHSEAIWTVPGDAPDPLHPGVAETLKLLARG